MGKFIVIGFVMILLKKNMAQLVLKQLSLTQIMFFFKWEGWPF
jgi:hypothetical protein